MRQTTICFLLRNGNVLLAMKKRGFGVGKWNGVGGKVEAGESIEAAAIREIKEEIGVSVTQSDLQKIGTLAFRFEDNPDWNQECHAFITRIWQGEPVESEEMRPAWYAIDRLPLKEMWIDDPHWLPLALAEKKIKGEFLFGEKGASILEYSVAEL